MISNSLDGKWKVRGESLSCTGLAGLKKVEKKRSGWIAAQVPGEIHLDLMRAGRLEEPLFSLNAKKSRWPEKKSWWFKTSFKVSAEFLEHERRQLVFDGLDLYAQVFLNGVLLGEAKNAFVPHAFDVRGAIRKGRNTLVVRLTVGAELAPAELQPRPLSKKVHGDRKLFPGLPHLRKPRCSYGFDWVDALPNIGIWRGVRLQAHSGIVLHDVRLDTHIDGKEVLLDGSVVVENLHPWSERAGRLELVITPPKDLPSPSSRRGKRGAHGQIIHKVNLSAQVGRSPVAFLLRIPNPKLWWPSGMGPQPLYRVTARVLHNGGVCDKRELDIGLRTVEVDRSAIAAGGSRFCIRVNGQDVFCRGGNWVPADAIMVRAGKRKHEALIAEARKANFTMLRVWGGGVYESPDFYDACDRGGILVWQDFAFSARYPDHNKDFRLAVRDEAEKAVMSLRHHPCIALWCGNNESLAGFQGWGKRPGLQPSDKDVNIDGSIIFNQVLPDVCRALDPQRLYWPSSPFGGEAPNDELDGDCHWWHKGTMNADVNRRVDHEVYDECRARFVSEYGVLGPPHLASMKQYLRPEELRIGSRAWQEHTNPYNKGVTLQTAIRRHYADPEALDLRDYILYGQMFQATMYGRSVEALRFRKHDPRDDCQGALIWMYNDNWGEIGWTPIDYYLRRKPSYYWLRNANLPVRAIVRRRGRRLVTRVVNDTLKAWKPEVHYGWMRIDGSDAKMQSRKIRLGANSMVEVGSDTVPSAGALNPREWIYAAYLTQRGLDTSPSVWLLAPYRELSVPEPEISVTAKGKTLRLVSKTYCHGVHVEDEGRGVLSDNYFDLLPRVPKAVTCLGRRNAGNLRFRAIGRKNSDDRSACGR